MIIVELHRKIALSMIVLGCFAALSVSKSADAATFDPSRIIDDGVFYNSSSMSVPQIQAFLNSKVPVCDNNGTNGSTSTSRATATRAAGYGLPLVCLKDYYENPSTHANNLTKIDGQPSPIPEGAQSAAQIISTAATYYGINPQVLIVLLQKEQHLVTDDWPDPSQYKSATGYGCPDTAPCATAYFGFYNQVNWAAKQYRLYANNPNSYNFAPGPGNFVGFNPNAGCGGTTLNIQGQATASLYNYTPYQPNAAALAAGYGTGDSCSAYGNRNFWLFFNDWFGSTLFPQPLGGSLLYQTTTGKIFLVTDSTRFYIPNWATMTNYGLSAYGSQAVSDATIQQYTDGGTLTNLSWDSGGVYLVNNGVRYHVSGAMCSSWGFSCTDSSAVKPLGAMFQTQYLKAGWELTELSGIGGSIYKMSGGQRLPIANPKTLSDLGYDSTAVLPASDINSSQPLGPLLITTPGIVAFPKNPTIYYYDGASYYSVNDMNVFSDWKLSGVAQLSVPASSYSGETAPSASALTDWYQDLSGQKFIIDQGRKLQIPANLQSSWAAVTFVTAPQALANGLSSEVLHPNVWANPDVYVVVGGNKHHVPTSADLIALGINGSNTTGMQANKLVPVPAGNDALGDGKILGIQGDNKLYVVNKGSLAHIADPNVFAAYGFSWSNIPTYPGSLVSDYPVTASDLVNGVTSDMRYLLPSGSSMLQLSQSAATDFGLRTTSFTPISSFVAKNAKPTTMAHFLYNNDNGKIYYGSGGAIHYVSSPSSFAAYGGNRSPITPVNSAILALFIEAQPI